MRKDRAAHCARSRIHMDYCLVLIDSILAPNIERVGGNKTVTQQLICLLTFTVEEHRLRWGARPSKPLRCEYVLGGFDSYLFRHQPPWRAVTQPCILTTNSYGGIPHMSQFEYWVAFLSILLALAVAADRFWGKV